MAEEPTDENDVSISQIMQMAQRIAAKNNQATNPEIPGGRYEGLGIGAEGVEEFDFSDVKAGAGASGPAGILLVSKDGGTETFISVATILEDYDPDTDTDWSVNIPVSSGEWDTAGTITYGTATAEYDATGSSQTVTRIRIIASENLVATYGVYKEGIACTASGPIVEFYAR